MRQVEDFRPLYKLAHAFVKGRVGDVAKVTCKAEKQEQNSSL